MVMPEMDIYGQMPVPKKTSPLVYVGIGLVALAAYLALD